MSKVKLQMGKRRPNTFYKQIATDYREFVVSGRETSVRIAEKYSVCVATAGGWVKRARELGYLEPKLRLCWQCHQPMPGQDLGTRVDQIFKKAESITVLKRIEGDCGDYAARIESLIDQGLGNDSLLLKAANHLRQAGDFLSQHDMVAVENAAGLSQIIQ